MQQPPPPPPARRLAARLLFPALAALAALAAVAPGCDRSSDDPPPAVPPAEDPRFVHFGAVLSITGELSSIGAAQRNGAAVAVRQLNALGGVLERPVELTVIDDGSDPAEASRALDRLLARGVRVIIGPTGGAAAVSLGEKTTSGSHLLLIPSTTPDVRMRAPGGGGAKPNASYVFRTAPSDAPQAKALAFFAYNAADAVQKEGCESAAIVSTDDEYGVSLGGQFAEVYGSLPGLITANLKLSALVKPDSEYAGVARQVLANKENHCQVVIATSKVGAAYLRAFRAAAAADPSFDASSFVTIGSDALRQDDFLSLGRDNPADDKSPTAGEGVFVVSPDTAPKGPRYSAFRELYLAQFPGAEPPPFSTNAYDAVMLAAMAVQLAGGADDPAPVRDGLLRLGQTGQAYGPGDVASALLRMRQGTSFVYASASGASTFDSQGRVVSDFVVAQIREGAFASTPLFFSASELE
jgi:branched-chain amino acid transport system substrate-binding protein